MDSNAAGWAEAFPFTGTTTGSAQSITVYVDSHNRAGTLIAGLYSDNNGHPGTLLASGTKTSPASAAWNTVGIASTAVTSGAKYWVTLLGKGGALYFRDRPNGTCRSESSAQTSLSALPSTWKTGPTWVTCPVSAYVSGTAGSSSTSSSGSTLPPSGSGGSPTGLLAPSNTARPTVSGNITQGQTLTTTDGAWSNVPTSYAYAWQDCDTAGNSCTTISGATTSSYTLTAADAGHTIRSVVTARNLLGSGTASSDPTVTVVPLPPATTAAPSVSGTATQGQTLTTSNGSWSNNPTGYAYAWQDCDSSGASCANIMGATSSSLTLTANDVGHTIRSVVTASNAGGSARATSNATAAVTAPAPPPAPANTAAPTISGTAQQGNTITTSNGSWSGSPTSFSYQWQDCNTSGASCTNISGATSSSHVLQGTDVGSTIRAVVTATNTSGSASASSAPTAAVTSNSGGGGGLPSGVTLQQLDGGPNYYSKFSNAVGWDSPNFYPIAVFNQSLGYNNGAYDASQITAYKNAGVNGFVGLYSGYNQALLNAIKSNNMWVIDGPLAPSYAGNPMNGYVWSDEADGNNRCGDVPSASVLGENVSCSPTSDGRTPASVMSQVTADLHGAHGTGDATRFVYGQYTKPVARNEGLTPSQASTYVNAVDVVSFDDYIINDGWESDHNLWEQADLVRNVRVEGNYNHPVMPFIEAGQPFTPDQWSGIRATPAMSVAEAWNAIIGGARGIQWFDHDFGGSTGGYANSGNDLIDPNPVFASLQAAVKSFNNEVTALAPVLNSLFANGYVTNTGAMNVMAKYDSSGKDFYVFAAPRSNSSQSIKFTVAGGYAGPVMVYGENRTLTATNGQFTDNFADQTAVHIYVIPNS
ncbi:MAG: hypothetical protein ACXVUL_13120 [Solirubrobacteraceae bacterium]